ncbi:MAG: phage portal protein, partial [Alphaproteobacteria bacterium]
MGLFDRLARLGTTFAGGWSGRSTRVTHLIARAYQAAQASRATWGWIAGSTSANAETYGAIPVLRDRARDLVRNNPYAAKAIDALVNNTIGAGIIPRAKTGDAGLNEKIDALWSQFEAEIDADGTHDFYGLQHLCARAFFESGEVLIRRRPRRINDGLVVPLQYQVLEADLL